MRHSLSGRRTHRIALWQDGNFGRLHTLDLTELLGSGEAQADRWWSEFMLGSRHAFRPWQGLRRVILPMGGAGVERSRSNTWERLIPGVEVAFLKPAWSRATPDWGGDRLPQPAGVMLPDPALGICTPNARRKKDW